MAACAAPAPRTKLTPAPKGVPRFQPRISAQAGLLTSGSSYSRGLPEETTCIISPQWRAALAFVPATVAGAVPASDRLPSWRPRWGDPRYVDGAE